MGINPSLILQSRGARVSIVANAMKRREVERALRVQGCNIKSERGPHVKFVCPCGQHSANIPRHSVISPGVVADIVKRMQCLPEGWLQ
jgi:predicted RNA binding protein YcfA (HicA-like mRNA interferase family)